MGRRQVELGTESFAQMWTDDARQRFDAKIAWIEDHASAITTTLQRS